MNLNELCFNVNLHNRVRGKLFPAFLWTSLVYGFIFYTGAFGFSRSIWDRKNLVLPDPKENYSSTFFLQKIIWGFFNIRTDTTALLLVLSFQLFNMFWSGLKAMLSAFACLNKRVLAILWTNLLHVYWYNTCVVYLYDVGCTIYVFC